MKRAERSIASTARQLAGGETSAVRLIEESLAALSRDGNRFNAVLTVNPQALAEAEATDRVRAAGRAVGPLHGIPLVVKDNIDVAGLPTTSGCRALAGAMPLRSAAIVERLRAAGAVIVAKANLSEFSFEIRSRSSLGGDVLHPLAPQATAGGSSGGTAVAVARGYALGGIGTDTGGSIRIPAAYNGLVGFRPAHGAVPMAGIAPLAPSADTVGPIAATVEDVALLLCAMGIAVAHPRHPPRRIGVLGEWFGSHAGVVDICRSALRRLEHAGLTMIEVPPLPAAIHPERGDHIVDAEFGRAFDRYLAANFVPGTAPRNLAELIATGEFLADHAAALQSRMAATGRETASILARHKALAAHLAEVADKLRLDAFSYPTSQVIPESLANPRGGWAPELAARSGWPAITVRAGHTAEGMPVGIEFLAAPGKEGLLLHLAAEIERLRD